MQHSKPKYVAEIHHVHEIALRGLADLSFWTDRLQEQRVTPIDYDGKAKLVLTAVKGKWMAFDFRELSISVFVSGELDSEPCEGCYLVHAFNSSRLLAFCERTFFHTPYFHADVSLDVQTPVWMRVQSAGAEMLKAEMSTGSGSQPLHSEDECFEAPIFLPRHGKSLQGGGELFWARLSGFTDTYAFSESDAFRAAAPTTDSPLAWLAESQFAGQEWGIKRDAVHSRSKAVQRSRS